MITGTGIWSNSYFVISLAIASISLLVASAWLFTRYRRQRRLSGGLYLLASIVLHLGLILWLPSLYQAPTNDSTQPLQTEQGEYQAPVEFSTFDPDLEAVNSSNLAQSNITPLPVNDLTQLIQEPNLRVDDSVEPNQQADDTNTQAKTPPAPVNFQTDSETASSLSPTVPAELPDLESEFDSLLEDAFAGIDAIDTETVTEQSVASNDSASIPEATTESSQESMTSEPTASSDAIANDPAPDTQQDLTEPADPSPDVNSMEVAGSGNPIETSKGTVLGSEQNDFANRVGDAKARALRGTGGTDESEAAVQRALEYLVRTQREDGAWDPRTTMAGLERSPLGTSRGSAGSQAETALTGLALLSLMGAGHTHQTGEYSETVYRGLAYLIRQQTPAGSMAGRANLYEATYCHGMAALAMCEAAAITQDASAMLSAQRAINHTQKLQHPTTGGWRYTQGDPGDLSQLGWQAMVLDAGSRAGLKISPNATVGVQRFLRSVQTGRYRGLASYRPGEATSRTMTAEAMATRLLIGDPITSRSLQESERYLMQELPGNGKDNYYFWYYATIALHQLQNDSWNRWNQALQSRLLRTQQSDGSWPTNTLWGGYGGTIYTTAMATLCLETYYRHTIRENKNRIAQQPNQPVRR